MNAYERYMREQEQREREQQLRKETLRQKRMMARRLVDSGFRALALKLHPDQGGNVLDMNLLTNLRNELKQQITSAYSCGNPKRECLACGHYLEPRKRKCAHCNPKGKQK